MLAPLPHLEFTLLLDFVQECKICKLANLGHVELHFHWVVSQPLDQNKGRAVALSLLGFVTARMASVQGGWDPLMDHSYQ